MLKGFAAKDIIEHEIHEVSSGVIFENDDFAIKTAELKHSVKCVGFKFQEKDRLRINVSKAKKLGLEGEILGKLQKGKNVIHEGEKIKFEDVTYSVTGKAVSYITDTMECNGIGKLAEDNDLLILEGTLLDNLRHNARKSKHLTVKQAALLAQQLNVNKLVITHISQRYKNNNEIIEEAGQYFPNVVVAEDFMKIEV